MSKAKSVSTVAKEVFNIWDFDQVQDDDPDSLTLELTESQPSGFFMDGADAINSLEDFDRADKTAQIQFPSLRVLRNRSKVMVSENNTTVKKRIRYIKDCPYIDQERQDREGWKPNHVADVITFKNGHLTVTKSGDVGLYLFIKHCEWNHSNENRPEEAKVIFKQIDTSIKEKNQEEAFDLETEAMAYLNTLKFKSGKATEYNEDAIEFLCSLFKLPSTGEFGSSAWVALATKAKSDPKKFLDSIAGSKKVFEVDVMQSIDFGVIGMDEVRAFFAESNMHIMEIDRQDSQESRISKIVDFFANPKNNLAYEQLRVQLRNKKNAKMDVIK